MTEGQAPQAWEAGVPVPRSWVPAVPEFETPPGMERYEFPAMGTRVTVLAPRADLPVAESVVRSLFEAWEGALSRFRPDSELSHVNRQAGRSVIVTKLFATVLTTALAAARATDGMYDPTLLPQLVRAGYDRTFDELPASRPAPGEAATPGGGWRAIKFDPGWRTVTIPPGVALDFGGIAKGMAVDAAVEKLTRLGVVRFAVEAGGDLRVRGKPRDGQGWPIAVQTVSGFETMTLFKGALATSSLSRRHWVAGDRLQHHILDPRSGEPADSNLWSVSAVAEQCVQADVAAKVAFVLGREHGGEFLVDHGMSGLMVSLDGQRHPIGLLGENGTGQ